MTENREVPAVALLFADAELGGHLRDALTTLGARIVHQGPAEHVSADVLRDSGADVVVVNLGPVDDGHLEHLYTALEDGPCQVVFNDAEASRNLSGWDKARWARHLAAKLVGSSDVDPPRPANARMVQVQAGAVSALALEPGMPADPPAPTDALSEASAGHVEPGIAPSDAARGTGQSEQLEVELEALLAANDASSETAVEDAVVEVAPLSQAADEAGIRSVDVEERQTVATPPPAADWELVDVNAAPAVAPAPADPQQFGIDKVSAESYLKPDAGDTDSTLEPGLELELVSLEASVAPTMRDMPDSEMVLDADGRAIKRVVVVSAGSEGMPEFEAFLTGLPAAPDAVVLLLAPSEGPSADGLAAALGGVSSLPVAMARSGNRTRHGEVLLVPSDQSCRVGRDGVVDLTAAETASKPSTMESCLVDATRTFGRGVTAIVLSGAGHDAVAAARHVREGGGQVWIPDPTHCVDDTAISAIHAGGWATCVGSPADLARRLCEANA